MKKFAGPQAQAALLEALEEVEARSAAEVVIAVRHHSGSYVHADLLVGIVAGIATLAFTLYSPFVFTSLSILLDPVVAGVALGLLSSQLPWLRRWLTPRAARRKRVQQAARATFYERGVRLTRDRTGVLVYLSLLERDAEVVADQGIGDRVPAAEWERAVARIRRSLETARGGEDVAPAIAKLAEVCEPYLERRADDVNELPNEVCAS